MSNDCEDIIDDENENLETHDLWTDIGTDFELSLTFNAPDEIIKLARKQRLKSSIKSSIHLRASNPPDTPNEELLRPAQDSGSTKPEELLRSHDISNETLITEENVK